MSFVLYSFMDLSIVIPALNEQEKITRDIRDAAIFLQSRNLDGEIIVVDDGSTDNTAERVREAPDCGNPVHLISYVENRGKGFAIRKGFEKSRGDIVLFIDSGSCIPLEDLCAGYRMILSNDCDIAHASRYRRDSVIIRPQKLSRRLSSRVFRLMIHLWMHIPFTLTDTQCGLKLYKGDLGRSLYESARTDGFMFDIEIILRAGRMACQIREFPIHWISDPDSRLSIIKTVFKMFRELLQIRRMLR